MGDADVQRALAKLAGVLDAAGIPYDIAGAMALNEYGYRRVTTDVNVLLTSEGLAALKQKVLGLGYSEKFPGSRGLRDTENGVNISQAKCRTSEDGKAVNTFQVSVGHVDQLKNVLRNLQSIEGVVSAERR